MRQVDIIHPRYLDRLISTVHLNMTLFIFTVHLGRQLLAQKLLERLAVLGEFLNALVELVERHLVLEQCPPEFGLVVDIADLGDGVGLCSCYRTSEWRSANLEDALD